MQNKMQNVKLAFEQGQPIQVKLATESYRWWEYCSRPNWSDEFDYRLAGHPTFDLDRAMAGGKLCTRDGQDAKFLIYASEALKEDYPVIVLIDSEVFHYTTEGRYHTTIHSDMDLFMLPTVRTYWINLYETHCRGHFESEAEADRNDALQSEFRIGRKAWPIEVIQPE